MAEKYNLQKILKEIEEDKTEEASNANRKLTQNEIDEKFLEKRAESRGQGKSKAAKK